MAVDFVTNFIATGSEKLIKTIQMVSQQSTQASANTTKALAQQTKNYLATSKAAESMAKGILGASKAYQGLSASLAASSKAMGQTLKSFFSANNLTAGAQKAGMAVLKTVDNVIQMAAQKVAGANLFQNLFKSNGGGGSNALMGALSGVLGQIPKAVKGFDAVTATALRSGKAFGTTALAIAKTTQTGSQLLGVYQKFEPQIKNVARLGAAWQVANMGTLRQVKAMGLLSKNADALAKTMSLFRFGALTPGLLTLNNAQLSGAKTVLSYFAAAEAASKRGLKLSTEQFKGTIILLRNWKLIAQTITASYAALRANIAGYEMIDLNMSRIKSKLGATETQLNKFRNTLNDIGREFGTLRAELAPIAEVLVLEEGLDLDQAGRSLEAFSALAVKNGLLIQETLDLITQAAGAMGEEDFALVADKVSIAAEGNTSIQDLATSMQLIGRSVQDSSAATSDAILGYTALLQGAGLDAQQAGGELQSILARIEGPIQELAAQGDRSLLGIDPETDIKDIGLVLNRSSDAVNRIAGLFRTAQGEVRELKDVLPELGDALGDYSESEQGIVLKTLFGDGVGTIKALLDLTEEEVSDMFDRIAGATGEITLGKPIEDSYGQAVARFGAAVEATGVKIAEAIEPLETAILNFSTTLLRSFDNLPAPLEKFLLIIGNFVPVLTLIGTLLAPLATTWVTWKVAIPLLLKYVDGLDRGVRAYSQLGKAQGELNTKLSKGQRIQDALGKREQVLQKQRIENLRALSSESEKLRKDQGFVDSARSVGGVDPGAESRVKESKARIQELQAEQLKLNDLVEKNEARRNKVAAAIDREAKSVERVAKAASGGEAAILALQRLPEEQAKFEEMQRKARVENLRLDRERLEISTAQLKNGIEIEKAEARMASYKSSLGISQGAPLLIKETQAELEKLKKTEVDLGEAIKSNDIRRDNVTQTLQTQSAVIQDLTNLSEKSTNDLGNYQNKISRGIGTSLGQVQNAAEAYTSVSDRVRKLYDQLAGVSKEIEKTKIADAFGVEGPPKMGENAALKAVEQVQSGFETTFGGVTAAAGKATSKIWGGFTTAATKAAKVTAESVGRVLVPLRGSALGRAIAPAFVPVQKALGGVGNAIVNTAGLATNAVKGIAGSIVNKIGPTVTAMAADMLPILALGVVIGAAADAFQRLTQQTAQAKKDVREMIKDFSEFLRLKQLEEGVVDTTVAFELESEGIKNLKEDLYFALKPFDAIGDAAERFQQQMLDAGKSTKGLVLTNFFATWNDVTQGQLRDIRKAFNMISDEGMIAAQEISKAFDDGEIDIDTESGQQALLTLQNALSKLSAANTQGQTDLEGLKRAGVGSLAALISKLQEGADGAVEAGESITLFTTAVKALDVAGGQLDLSLLEEQKQAYIDFAGDAAGLQARLEEIEVSGAARRLALLKESLIKIQESQADDGEEKQTKIADIQQQILQLEIQGYQKRLGEQEDFQEESKASLIDSLQEKRDIELDEIQDAGQLRKLAILSDDSLTADQRSAALLNMEKNLNAETLVQKQLALAELVDKGVQATKEEETKRLALIEKYEDEMVGIRIQMTEAYITATEKATEEQQRLAEEAAEEQQRIAEESAEELERIEQERIELEDANREASTQKELRDIDLISAKYQAATDAKVAGFDAVLEAIDDQNDALTQQGKLLDLQIEKLQIQADRTAAGDDARIAGLENAGELIARLNSGEADIVEKRLIQQQLTRLGLSDKTTELELLDAQQQAESNRRRNENILLQKRQELEVVQLQNQQAQEQLALKRAVTEAQINKTKAQQLVIDQQILQLQNQVALVRAQSALDVAKSRGASPAELVALQTEVDAQTQINKLGQQGLDAAQAGVTLADEQVADAKDAVAEYQKIAELQTQNLNLSQSFALSQKQAADETERLAAALERARLAGDRAKANAIVGTPEVEPKRHGGTVTPGSLYQVNEAGVEAFKPLGGKPQLLNQPANSLFSPLVPGRILTAPQVNQMLPSFSNGSSGGLVGLGRLESEIRGLRSDIASRPVQVDMGASTFINEPSPLATQLQIARGRLKAARGLL